MVNKVFLIGRLGKDPEGSLSNSGETICKFTLATDRGYGDKKKTDWHNIVAFKKTADFCIQYLLKGLQVYIEGAVTYNEWEKDGKKHYKTEILANNVQSLSAKNPNGFKEQPIETQPEPLPDDKIPF